MFPTFGLNLYLSSNTPCSLISMMIHVVVSSSRTVQKCAISAAFLYLHPLSNLIFSMTSVLFCFVGYFVYVLFCFGFWFGFPIQA